MKEVYDSVGAVPRESVTYENVIKPLVDLDGDVHTESETITVRFRMQEILPISPSCLVCRKCCIG